MLMATYVRVQVIFHSTCQAAAESLASGQASRVSTLAAQAMALSAGTFREDVEDVLANDRHAIVLARHRFMFNGSPKDYRTAHVYEVQAGQLARCFEQPQDPAAFHAAWGASEA
jgi:hypothetical protein